MLPVARDASALLANGRPQRSGGSKSETASNKKASLPMQRPDRQGSWGANTALAQLPARFIAFAETRQSGASEAASGS